ncbi:protein of unknown function DUF1223 [Cellulophaga algicola DSM 14237]|uniref:Uncharacterized protein n=1 Tax=Cellulophaga algicola (strain DSM 14237 / IC166 / ACAM 630) TaxID=688270 RepID=E6X432_CELAD|nr:DUF1223 domain-containing protein [Cellulophaga algicola]ADV50374.1 protein of unknown function DUF1223 [Cellulophaga algicola DSM 14237]
MKNKGIILGLLLISFAITSFKIAFNPGVESVNLPVNKNQGVVVVALYTSQGCSSCPPADVLLDQVKKEFSEEVIPLSYHVDYWNYIGWKDPFSKAIYTKKQTAYNYKFKNRSNYTPQVVVNGVTHFVGSNSSEMYANINTYKKIKPSNKLTLTYVKASVNTINFDYEITGDLSNKKLRVVLVLDKRVTEVKRGENRNRTLVNSNIVVAEKYLNLKTNNSEAIQIPDSVLPNEKISLVLIAENSALDITGATKISVNR